MMQPTIIYDDGIDCDCSDDYTNNYVVTNNNYVLCSVYTSSYITIVLFLILKQYSHN